MTSGKAIWTSKTSGKGVKPYSLKYQTDGNLVLYDSKNKALWSSNTAGKSVGKAIMQTDGNFVIYDSNNSAIWSTSTSNM